MREIKRGFTSFFLFSRLPAQTKSITAALPPETHQCIQNTHTAMIGACSAPRASRLAGRQWSLGKDQKTSKPCRRIMGKTRKTALYLFHANSRRQLKQRSPQCQFESTETGRFPAENHTLHQSTHARTHLVYTILPDCQPSVRITPLFN
jgi:hypothetical protein